MAGFPIFKFSGSRLTRKFSEIIATYLNPGDMQQIKDTYSKKYTKQFEDLISVLEPFNNPPKSPKTPIIFKNVDRGELLLLALPTINRHLKKLLSKISILFDYCSQKCTAKINNPETRKQLKELQLSDAYAYAQVCKTERVKKCIQFMTLVGLFETKLAKVDKLVDSFLNNRATRGRTPSSRDNIRKSISPNISISINKDSKKIDAKQFENIHSPSPNISRTANAKRRNIGHIIRPRISPDSSVEIRKFQDQYTEFLGMISRKTKGGKRRTKKIMRTDNTCNLLRPIALRAY